MSQTFGRAVTSFIGHLEGTHKSLQTIQSYKSDLNQFHLYIQKRYPKDSQSLARITPMLLDEFISEMERSKEKPNTQRRKLLTIQKFLKYLSGRKKISATLSNRIPTPGKVERAPKLFNLREVTTLISELPSDTHLHSRNRLILWVLAETGCQVSEVAKLEFDDFTNGERPAVMIRGKLERFIPISQALQIAAFEHRQWSQGSNYLFRGFNRAGSLPERMSDRAVELVVKSYRTLFGVSSLTPRAFRRTIVMEWFARGLSQAEIKQRLGLKSDYAFKVYEPLLKKKA